MGLKKNFLIFCFFSALLLSGAAVSYAVGTTQDGHLELFAPETIIVREPANFDFPVNFVDYDNSFNTYALLDPGLPESLLEIFDSNDASGFLVTIAITDLTSNINPENVIHLTNLGLVTISQSPSGIDSGIFNRPPGSPNVTAFLNCPWTQSGGTIETQCDSQMIDFLDLPGTATTLLNNLELTDTETAVADISSFSDPPPGEPLSIIIGDDLVTYTGITGNMLTGLSGIGKSHAAGATVTQHWNTSGQITLLENSSTVDTGTYSVGFGFRLNIRPEFKQDYYNGTLLFTLITI